MFWLFVVRVFGFILLGWWLGIVACLLLTLLRFVFVCFAVDWLFCGCGCLGFFGGLFSGLGCLCYLVFTSGL